MTLDEFLDKRPEIATANRIEHFFAVAWFFLRHEDKPRFTLKEMMDRMKEVGLDNWNVPVLANRFCGTEDKKLINTVDGTTHYYALMRHIKDALDQKYKDCLQSPVTIAASKAIAELPSRFPTLNGCPYWHELMLCHNSGALRATVIMAWNLVYNRLCEYILADAARLAAFNQKSTKTVTIRDDFTEFKEFDVITWSKTSGIVIPNIYNILAERLKRRNMFAHASGMIPIPHDVDTFILDLVVNMLPRLV
jgi:uncharacterized membrane protein